MNDSLARWLKNPKNYMHHMVGWENREKYKIDDVTFKSIRYENPMVDPTRRKWPAGRTEIWIPVSADVVIDLKKSMSIKEDASEDKRRAEFKRQYPYFDALVKAGKLPAGNIPVSNQKGSKAYLSPSEAKILSQKGYIEKVMDSDWKNVSYFADLTQKGGKMLRNLWDHWMDL